MWEQQEVRRMAPGPWGLVTGVALLPLVMGVLAWWNRSDFSSAVWGHMALYWAALTATRVAGGAWYNLTARWHRGVLLWWTSGHLAAVDVSRLWRVAAVMWPQGAVAAVLLNICGAVPPGIPDLWLAAGGALTGGLAAVGSGWLYSSAVVAVSDMLGTRWEASGPVRLAAVDGPRLRTVVGTLVFAWGVLVTAVSVGGLWLGLVAVAGRLPAGYFGLGVGFFVGFVLLLFFLVLAILAGLWALLLAALYNWWGARGGGLWWEAARRSVPLPPREAAG